MIKIIFTCEKCGGNKGHVVNFDKSTEVQCDSCGEWETILCEDTYVE